MAENLTYVFAKESLTEAEKKTKKLYDCIQIIEQLWDHRKRTREESELFFAAIGTASATVFSLKLSLEGACDMHGRVTPDDMLKKIDERIGQTK